MICWCACAISDTLNPLTGTAPTEEDASTRMPLRAGGSSPEYSQNTPGMARGSAECGSNAAGERHSPVVTLLYQELSRPHTRCMSSALVHMKQTRHVSARSCASPTMYLPGAPRSAASSSMISRMGKNFTAEEMEKRRMRAAQAGGTSPRGSRISAPCVVPAMPLRHLLCRQTVAVMHLLCRQTVPPKHHMCRQRCSCVAH